MTLNGKEAFEMKPVMLATDGSPTAAKAAETAVELARKLQTDLVIVSVWDIPYPAYSAMGFAPVPMNEELARLGEAEAGKALGEAAARAEKAGVETRTAILRGFPVEAICEAADRFAPLFLVIGSHGWGAVKRALFGSVSTGVLHHAHCPVLVVRGEPVEGDAADDRSHDAIPA
jgi:nucleotide-binding universal stress UspA family protein